jgi:hypothetical protein
MNKIRIIFIVFILTLYCLLSACATTKLTDVWSEPSFSDAPFKKILVIGLTDDDMKRRLFEQTFVENLQSLNVEAQPGYLYLPADAKPEKETVTRAIEGKGFDAVLITHYKGTDEESIFVPGSTYYGRSGYSGYYNTYRRPGYYSKKTTIYLQTNLYRTADEKLLWAARSETINPTSKTEAIDSFSKAVMKKLEKGGYVQSRGSK